MVSKEEVDGLKAALDSVWGEICERALKDESAPLTHKIEDKLVTRYATEIVSSGFIMDIVTAIGKNRWNFDKRAFRTCMIHAAAVCIRAVMWADREIKRLRDELEENKQPEEASEHQTPTTTTHPTPHGE